MVALLNETLRKEEQKMLGKLARGMNLKFSLQTILGRFNQCLLKNLTVKTMNA